VTDSVNSARLPTSVWSSVVDGPLPWSPTSGIINTSVRRSDCADAAAQVSGDALDVAFVGKGRVPRVPGDGQAPVVRTGAGTPLLLLEYPFSYLPTYPRAPVVRTGDPTRAPPPNNAQRLAIRPPHRELHAVPAVLTKQQNN
jgi:hypothetical protein